ncbi:MAG TPA: tetratricopeptide repeat protein, partial [Sphingomicrobium sp.]|nr:tetratricopeptide repeat protein [Sphingomicrobium sp.]
MRNIAQDFTAVAVPIATFSQRDAGKMPLTKFHIGAMLSVLVLASPAQAQMGGGMSPSSGAQPEADATVNYQKGIAAFKAGDYPTAIRELRSARLANSSDGNIPYALGLAYAASGKKPEALKAFQNAVRTSNAPPPAYLQLGL